jgi:hypothetical protein
MVDAGEFGVRAADRVDAVLRGADAPFGLDARCIATHGSPAYERAFAKLLQHGEGAAMRMTSDEQAAAQAANQAAEMRTAMVKGAGSTGGFGIPIAIDPGERVDSKHAAVKRYPTGSRPTRPT